MGYDDNALSYVLAKVPGFGLMQTAHAVFNDEVFPCRKQTSDWNTEVAFDADVADPLSHWMGRGRLPEQFVYGKPGRSDNQGENCYAEVVEGFDPDPAIPMPQVSAPATSAPENGVAPSSSSIPGPVRRSARGSHRLLPYRKLQTSRLVWSMASMLSLPLGGTNEAEIYLSTERPILPWR